MYGTDHYESLLRAQREANELFARLETASPTEDEVRVALAEELLPVFADLAPSLAAAAEGLVPLAQDLGVTVGGGPIVTVIHPQHGDIRMHLRHQGEQSRFVGTKIGRDHNPTTTPGHGPADNLLRRATLELGGQGMGR